MGLVFILCGIGITTISPYLPGGFFIATAFFIGGGLELVKGAFQAAREESGAGDASSSTAQPARLVSGTISDDDYPAAALAAEASGEVTATFTVGRDGVPREISIAESSGCDALDCATARLIADRFRFEPARGRNRNPVPERRRQGIVWRLPDD